MGGGMNSLDMLTVLLTVQLMCVLMKSRLDQILPSAIPVYRFAWIKRHHKKTLGRTHNKREEEGRERFTDAKYLPFSWTTGRHSREQ